MLTSYLRIMHLRKKRHLSLTNRQPRGFRVTLRLSRRLMLVFALAAFVAPPLATAGKKPITHEDLWLMRRVGAPAPSPDGKWVAFPGHRAGLR